MLVILNAARRTHAVGNHTSDSTLNAKWEAGLGYILHKLDDIMALQRSNFTKVSGVRRFAEENYPGRSMPEGRALRDIVIQCVTIVLADLGAEAGCSHACRYLELAIKGVSCREISRDLKLSREHVSRTYRRQALQLLARQFVLTVRRKPLAGK